MAILLFIVAIEWLIHRSKATIIISIPLHTLVSLQRHPYCTKDIVVYQFFHSRHRNMTIQLHTHTQNRFFHCCYRNTTIQLPTSTQNIFAIGIYELKLQALLSSLNFKTSQFSHFTQEVGTSFLITSINKYLHPSKLDETLI